jgi:hypothetical protein
VSGDKKKSAKADIAVKAAAKAKAANGAKKRKAG